MSGIKAHPPATKQGVIDVLNKATRVIDCALRQPPIPTGKHEFQPTLKLVPEVGAFYPSLFWLYTQVDEAKDFREPLNAVDLMLLDYFDVVQTPKSIRDVLDAIAGGDYSSVKQVMEDVDLIWSNCRQYNGAESLYYSNAEKCRQKLEAHVNEVKDNAVATVEEQDRIVELIQSVGDDQFNDRVMELLEKIAPQILKDGELDVNMMTVRVCREIGLLHERYRSKRPRE